MVDEHSETSIPVEETPAAYRSRWAVCDDCETVTILERDDPRGVPEDLQAFPTCFVCDGSLDMGNADERTIAKVQWAMGRRAGKREAAQSAARRLRAKAVPSRQDDTSEQRRFGDLLRAIADDLEAEAKA